MNTLNNLSGAAWAKLSKSVWLSPTIIQSLQQQPYSDKTKLLIATKTRGCEMPLADIDEQGLT
jgi:hypothetical protein